MLRRKTGIGDMLSLIEDNFEINCTVNVHRLNIMARKKIVEHAMKIGWYVDDIVLEDGSSWTRIAPTRDALDHGPTITLFW